MTSTIFHAAVIFESGIITLTERYGSTWTGKITKIPRHILSNYLQKEPASSGVYLLAGRSEIDGIPAYYVGESGDIRARMGDHRRRKPFWDDCILITRLDPWQLDITEIKYIESCLIDVIGRCPVETHNRKPQRRPQISPDRARDLDTFLSICLENCLPILGFDTIHTGLDTSLPIIARPAPANQRVPTSITIVAQQESPTEDDSVPLSSPPVDADVCAEIDRNDDITEAASNSPKNFTHRLFGKTVRAFAVFDASKQTMTLLAGSRISAVETTVSADTTRLRRTWRESAMISQESPDSTSLLLREDVPGLTPSGASQAVLGQSSNGWRDWKTIEGDPLDLLRHAAKRKSPQHRPAG